MDIVKITNSRGMRGSLVNGKICRIIKINEGIIYPYIVEYLENVDTYYHGFCDEEIIRISAEEAMLEIL